MGQVMFSDKSLSVCIAGGEDGVSASICKFMIHAIVRRPLNETMAGLVCKSMDDVYCHWQLVESVEDKATGEGGRGPGNKGGGGKHRKDIENQKHMMRLPCGLPYVPCMS